MLKYPEKVQTRPYDVKQISALCNLKIRTVYTRFYSKYAKHRWGVNFYELRDGSIKRFVSKKDLSLWQENPNYIGRPVKKKKGTKND